MNTPPPLPSSGSPLPISPVTKPNSPFAIWSFWLGIAAMCIPFFALIAGIPGIVLGHIGLARTTPVARTKGRGFAVAGVLLSYCATIVTIILTIVLFANFDEVVSDFRNEIRKEFPSPLVGAWRIDEGLGSAEIRFSTDGSYTANASIFGTSGTVSEGNYVINEDGRLILSLTKPLPQTIIYKYSINGEILTLRKADGSILEYVRTTN